MITNCNLRSLQKSSKLELLIDHLSNIQILDFLNFETKFRNEFESKIRTNLNTSQATIVYEEPFPIVNQNQTVLTILVANRTFDRLVVSENGKSFFYLKVSN